MKYKCSLDFHPFTLVMRLHCCRTYTCTFPEPSIPGSASNELAREEKVQWILFLFPSHWHSGLIP